MWAALKEPVNCRPTRRIYLEHLKYRYRKSLGGRGSAPHPAGEPVAPLGWVTPGVATEGVTPLCFPEKPGDLLFLSRQFCGVIPDDLFCSSLYRFLLLSLGCLGCHPFEGVTLHLFYLSDLVSPLFFVNLPTNFFLFGCHPPGGCHAVRSARLAPSP